MAGYLKTGTPAVHVVPDVLALLPAVAGRRGDDLRYFKFGKAIHALPIDASASLAEPITYSCRGHHGDCDNNESRIDLVLRAAQQGPPGDLTIIVTDFWLTDSDLAASGELGIGLPLASLFAKGRTIDLIGVRAPYAGPIYDLPNGLNYLAAKERALFIILVGPANLVQVYSDALLNSASPAFAVDRVHESLFSASPFMTQRIDSAWRYTRHSQAITQQSVLPPAVGGGIGQFVIAKSDMADEPNATISTTVDISRTLRRNAIWSGSTITSATIWTLNNEDQLASGQCDQGTWSKFANLSGILTQSADTQEFDFTLKPQSQLAILTSDQTYVVVGEIDQAAIDTPNPADKWLRDWSFDISTEAAVVQSRPAFFPTLNLSQTASILEYELNQSLVHGRVVAKSYVGIKVAN